MTKRTPYWIGKRPSSGKRWAYTTSAEILNPDQYHEALLGMYRRYVKQWNDIELDRNRSLSEHTHEIHEAKVVGGWGRCFILHWHSGETHWILEIYYSKGFSEFYPGWSCARNPFRSNDDIRSAHLHWNSGGREEFDRWLEKEKESNKRNGEWDEYRA